MVYQLVVAYLCFAVLMGASSAYSPSYTAQSNADIARKEQQKQAIERNTAISASRSTLSPNCLAYRSAVLAGNIDIHESSPSKGFGAFAAEPIQCGTYLGEYTGECMTLNEVRARFWNKREPDVADIAWAESRRRRNQDITGNYVLEVAGGSFICAEDGELSTWTRFMNHSPEDHHETNVKAFMQTEVGGDIHQHPRFFAIRNIEEGEELQYDYGQYFNDGFGE